MIRAIKIIALKDIKELMRENRMLLMFAITAYIMLSVPYDLFEDIIRANPQFTVLALDFYFMFFSWMAVVFTSFAAVYRVFFKEKNSKTILSLLATPLSLRGIWLGKSMAVFVVGYGQVVLLSLVFWALINYLLLEELIWPGYPALAALFIINPLISFFYISAIGILYLLIKDEMKVRFGFIVLMGMLFYLLRPENLILGWGAIPFLLLVLAFFIIVNIIAHKLLNTERIIFSVER